MLRRVLIFGNSGSGKTSLAKALCEENSLAHLDLDSLAWAPTNPPQRADLECSKSDIECFTSANNDWVIEGCYTDLLEMVAPLSTEIIFLNLPVEDCIANARRRPWEPHKYPSKAAQDNNLPMLLEWISQYTNRGDTFSFHTHHAFFEGYKGKKQMYRTNAH